MSRWIGAKVGIGVGVFFLVASPRAALADGQAPKTADADADNVSAARAHFTKGRDLYLAGSYHEAITELDAARALDPKAKDLVYNLAIVHEKLGEIDEALRYARLYVEMDLDPAERTRAETYIKRLEGAKAEVKHVVVPPPPPKNDEHEHGRFDAAVIVAGVVAIGAAGAGAAFGIKALADKPSNFVTGTNGTYSQLQSAVSTAHTEAVVADVCFGGAAAAAITAVVLYFAREKDPGSSSGSAAPSSSSASSPSSLAAPTFTLRPLLGQTEGGLMLVGSF